MTSRSSPATCSITVSDPDNWTTSKTLTANVNSNGASVSGSAYKWSTGGSWTSSTQTTVAVAGAIQLTIKDSNNLENNCSVTLKSRLEYQHKTCQSANSCDRCPAGYHETTYYCYYAQAYVTQSECTEGDWDWVDGACYQAVILKPHYNNDAGHCGCTSWTDVEGWFPNSCGNSDYSDCKDRGTPRTTFMKSTA